MNRFLQRIIQWFLLRVPFGDLEYIYLRRKKVKDDHDIQVEREEMRKMRKEMEIYIECGGELFKHSLYNIYCPALVPLSASGCPHPKLPMSCLMGDSKVTIDPQLPNY